MTDAHDYRAFGVPCGSDFGRIPTPCCQSDLPEGSIWDPGTGTAIRRIHGPDGTAYGAAVDATGTRLAIAGADGQIKVWNVVLGRLDHAFEPTKAGSPTSASARFHSACLRRPG